MKNLANCKPSEFLRQTSRIRKSVENWLTVTDIMNIRKRLPEYEVAEKGASKEEKDAVVERNRKLDEEQVMKNTYAILDAVLDEHADETLEILALMCFVEPEKVDDHPVSDYIESFNELISNQAVIGFFTSLMRLGQMDMPGASRK